MLRLARAFQNTNASRAHHSRFQFRRLAIKDVCRLDSVLNHANSAVEETHEVTECRESDANDVRGP